MRHCRHLGRYTAISVQSNTILTFGKLEKHLGGVFLTAVWLGNASLKTKLRNFTVSLKITRHVTLVIPQRRSIIRLYSVVIHLNKIFKTTNGIFNLNFIMVKIILSLSDNRLTRSSSF